MVREVFLQVIAMHGAKMTDNFLLIQNRSYTTDGGKPSAEYAVRKAAGSILIFGAFSFEQLACFGRVLAAITVELDGVLCAQVLPFDLLNEILAIKKLSLHELAPTLIEGVVKSYVIAECCSHKNGGMKRTEVNAGAHARWTPKLNVVGVVVRLFDPSFVFGVPGLDAVVETLSHLRPKTSQPFRVTADAPLPIDLHDSAGLPIRGGGEVVADGADRKRRPKLLVPLLILVRTEFGFAKTPFKFGKQMRHSLRVVPHVRTRSRATAYLIRCAFPGPELSVALPQHGRRFENGQVACDSIHHFGW